ncbi:hypothetical protein [Candidatus Methanocrinis natronophilus]|uniref:ArsR family transcriptional regulator n=1 Tax=Candidatus Methanocrinis natronophilus TaxID=3033396 RepID=A0ABT5X4R6_9EURY|nr:hypothetical protein [Candidatus Methanocrinis natronophilus]MDF0589698.1 hypothetical protein [Candidatus Methanocrinis natronophilus]
MKWQDTVKQSGEERTSLVLMYLALGEDYSYNMAKKYFSIEATEEKGWSEDKLKKLKSLKDPSQLSHLLKKMEKKELLVSSDTEVNGRNRHVYRLNPQILCSILNIPNMKNPTEAEIIKAFLDELSKKEREPYFDVWRTMEILDFISFLYFLENESKEHDMNEATNILSKIIDDHFELEKSIRKIQSKINSPFSAGIRLRKKARRE